MRNTSLDAYESIKDDLSKKQLTVLQALKTLKTATNRQISKYLDWEINRVTGRTNELYNKGFIIGDDRIKDTETNRTVTLWKYDN